MSIEDIMKQLGPLSNTIDNAIGDINKGGNYDIGVDIIHRSRELAALYFKIDEDYKAIEILKVLNNYRYGYNHFNTPCEVAQDVEVMLKAYKKNEDKEGRVELLKTMIERYPDYSSVNVWKRQLNNFLNVDK